MTVTHRSANLLILLAAVFWGFSNVSQKHVLDHLGPLTAVGLRCLLAALVILPMIRYEGGKGAKSLQLRNSQIPMVAAIFTVAILLQQLAYGGTTVTNGSFLVNTATVMTPLVAFLVKRTIPPSFVWFAVALSFTGVGLMVGGDFSNIAWGDGVMLLAAAAYALWYVLQGDTVTLSGRPLEVTVIQFAMAGTINLGLGLALEQPTWLGIRESLPHLVVLGIFGTGLSYALLSIGQRHTSASEAAILCSAEAAFGMLGGIMILGEQLTACSAVGAMLIGSAVLLVQLGPALMGFVPPRNVTVAQVFPQAEG